jgi:hypothetical protein
MKLRLYIQTFLAVAFLILAVSCGGGGGGSSGGGIGGSGVTSASSGSVQGFGSIFVNDRELETDTAEVEIEGEDSIPCSPSLTEDCGLREGMVIRVEGSFDDNGTTGTATRIEYEDNLKGPIDNVTVSTQGSAKTLSVMGQQVIVEDGVTQFDDSDPTFNFNDLSLANNDDNVIEVSGFDDGTRIRATYMRKKADDLASFLGAANELEIKGTVSALNFNPPNSFEINGLTIDFAGVPVRNGTLAVGALVEVKGNNLVDVPPLTLSATDVEIKPAGLGVDDIAKAEVEGYIASLDTTAKTFVVNGQPVSYASASFDGGTVDDLGNGVKVEAEGPISGGTLQAVKIEFEDSVKFEANADNVNAGAGTLTLQNLPGISVLVDDLTTEFEGVGSLSGISAGNELKIRGRRVTGTNDVVATEIELIDTNPADRTIIQGPVDSHVDFVSVTILGVLVDTSTIGDNDFKDHDNPIGEAAFYGNLADGDLVKARFRSGAWDQIEFED